MRPRGRAFQEDGGRRRRGRAPRGPGTARRPEVLEGRLTLPGSFRGAWPLASGEGQVWGRADAGRQVRRVL